MQSNAPETPSISVIIPVRDGEATLGKCLDSLVRNPLPGMEVIVVDDGSEDRSREIAAVFPFRLISLGKRCGASAARNAGAREASASALFFTDADCLLCEDTLKRALMAYKASPGSPTGGTYTQVPHDKGFFSAFQSVFVNYSETKRARPDYVATHAMVIDRELFLRAGGFSEDFMPILEDVEFSHRLKHRGVELMMDPDMLVEHVFGFTLWGSLRNAFRKSMYWTMYSIRNHDLLKDSGTASLELKANVLSCYVCAILTVLAIVLWMPSLMVAAFAIYGLNLLANRHFLTAMVRARGISFTLLGLAYYSSLYPAAVGLGGMLGALRR